MVQLSASAPDAAVPPSPRADCGAGVVADGKRPHRVVVLALEGVVPFELGIPARIFSAPRDPAGDPLYEVLTCGVTAGAVPSGADYAIQVAHGAELLATADTVVIPPAYPILDLIRGGGSLPAEVAGALARIPAAARKVAICTGSFVFASAGFLDGRRVTTHWAEADRLAEMFPALDVNPHVLFIEDGDILTSAGGAAGIDLCLHILRGDHGSAVANAVARICVVPPSRAGGQAQYIERPVPPVSATGTGPVRAWALERLDQPLTLQDLAAHGRTSVRTFTRQFRGETGISPGQWLAQQRVDLARHLLEATDLPIDRIAERAGFGTATSLRQNLRTTIGVSPNAYRRTFQAGRVDTGAGKGIGSGVSVETGAEIGVEAGAGV
jgi:transcriptional regulator GlxA family with amidase domain